MGGSSESQSARAPQRYRPERADQRRGGGGGSSSGQAVPRGSSNAGGGGSRGGESSTGSSAGSNNNSQGQSRAPVPAYSRPRDGRTPVGTATDRTYPPPCTSNCGGGGGVYYPGVIYDPYYGYYNPYYYGGGYANYWSPWGFGFGLGYFSYDPFLFGAYNPYGYGYGYDPYGYGYGGGGYGGGGYSDPSQSGGSGYTSSSGGQYRGSGALRLKVKPNNAQVYVDGYFIGAIDNFDGMFQSLGVEAGAHKVELKAEGYETAQFDVMVAPGETVIYKGEMKRIH